MTSSKSTDENVRRKILEAYLTASILLGPGYAGFFALFGAWANFAAPALFTVMSMAALVLCRAQRLKASSRLLVLSLWAAPAWCTLVSGGIYSPLIIWLTPTPFMAGALLGRRPAIMVGTMSVSLVAISALFNVHNVFPNEFPEGLPRLLLFVGAASSAIGLITFYGYSSTKNHEEAQAQMQKHNENMRILLDNVDQGFLTIELDGSMASERSAAVHRYLGFPEHPRMKFCDYLAQHNDSVAAMFEAGWDAVLEGIMPFESVLGPQQLDVEDRSFELSYQPLDKETERPPIIVVITDITESLRRAEAEEETREQAALFTHFMRDSQGVRTFFEDTRKRIVSISYKQLDEKLLQRELHTIKGNCALFSLTSIARLCHQLEDKLAERNLTEDDHQNLRTHWSEIEHRMSMFFQPKNSLEVSEIDYGDLLLALKQKQAHEKIYLSVTAWTYIQNRVHLERLRSQAGALAHRFGKGDVEVKIDSDDVRLPAEQWRSFWSVLVHLVRNAIDHGLPPPSKTQKKNEIELSARVYEDTLRVIVRDNGRGIDWSRVAQKASQKGLPTQTRNDLVAALLSDNFSTRDELTETSGRGVGLAAVAAEVKKRGGSTQINSDLESGATFTLVLPLSLSSNSPSQTSYDETDITSCGG